MTSLSEPYGGLGTNSDSRRHNWVKSSDPPYLSTSDAINFKAFFLDIIEITVIRIILISNNKFLLSI